MCETCGKYVHWLSANGRAGRGVVLTAQTLSLCVSRTWHECLFASFSVVLPYVGKGLQGQISLLRSPTQCVSSANIPYVRRIRAFKECEGTEQVCWLCTVDDIFFVLSLRRKACKDLWINFRFNRYAYVLHCLQSNSDFKNFHQSSNKHLSII